MATFVHVHKCFIVPYIRMLTLFLPYPFSFYGHISTAKPLKTRVVCNRSVCTCLKVKPSLLNVCERARCSAFCNASRGSGVQILCGALGWHRFSAFWLRSKCSICSYQLNIWYVPHRGTTILNWFLELGEVSGACSAFATGWPGIAVPPGPAHSPRGFMYTIIITTQKWTDLFTFVRAWLPWPFCALD